MNKKQQLKPEKDARKTISTSPKPEKDTKKTLSTSPNREGNKNVESKKETTTKGKLTDMKSKDVGKTMKANDSNKNNISTIKAERNKIDKEQKNITSKSLSSTIQKEKGTSKELKDLKDLKDKGKGKSEKDLSMKNVVNIKKVITDKGKIKGKVEKTVDEEEKKKREKNCQKLEKYIEDSGLNLAFQIIFSEIVSKKILQENFFTYTSMRLRQIGKEFDELKGIPIGNPKELKELKK